jgi:peroxiredoxin
MIILLGGIVSGGALIYLATTRGKSVPGVDMAQPRHPVTADMEAKVTNLNQRIAPFFKLPDTDGKPTIIGGAGPRPQFLYFVKKGCPCSFDAEPLFQSLYKKFNGKIDFIAVTDAEAKDAHKWDLDLKVPYSVVSNPTVDIMNAYQAPSSVYNSLISKEGVIVNRWAGYSKAYLTEMNEAISKLLAVPLTPFDVQYAPIAGTTGCSFTKYQEGKSVWDTPSKQLPSKGSILKESAQQPK